MESHTFSPSGHQTLATCIAWRIIAVERTFFVHNATFQKDMLELISTYLSEEEHDLARRARNLPIPVGRKNIQHDYRLATAFEVLTGYWYLHDKERLEFFYNKFRSLEFFS